ncbi:MAG: adenylate/guanylate cyclase domain-containing protein [Halieaceae bacterium]
MKLVRWLQRYLQRYGLAVLVGLALTVFSLWLLVADAATVRAAVNRLDYLIYDLRLRATLEASDPAERDVIIINIDEKSLEAQGRWPWSRLTIADLVMRLNQFGAKTIGLDVSFPEPERNAAVELLQSQSTETADVEQLQFLQSLVPAMDRDALLASVLPGRNVVLGVMFLNEDATPKGELPPPWYFVDLGRTNTWRVPDMESYSSNLTQLTNAASEGGFLNATPDDDGVVRRSPLIMRYGDLIYPSLALAMAKVHNDRVGFKINTAAIREEVVVTSLQLDKQQIGTDSIGRVLVPYRGGRHSFEYISATDILNASSLQEFPQLQGKAVLVGTTALGLYDLRNTPIEPSFPGVEIQANVLQGLIDGISFPREPDWAKAALVLLVLGLGMGLSLVAPLLSAGWLVVVSVALMVPLMMADFWLWASYQLSFSPVIPLLMVLLIALYNGANGFFNEAELRGELHDMFGQYVPTSHIDSMMDDPESISFAGETRDMSVLFADIRNFTTISEHLEVNQLKQMLNEFFTPMTGIIFNCHGTIDKYIGDLVMAFWGAPLEDPNHRKHAISAALKMLAKVDELRPIFVEQGLPEIAIGIGVNSGTMNVGDMGSEYRRSYTVLGDAVNLGSRLEGLTKFYGVSLLVGEETRDHCEDFLYRYIDKVMVKGKDEPIRIYEPLCLLKDADEELLNLQLLHEEAMRCYMEQEWEAAERAFEQIAPGFENKQVEIFLARLQEIQVYPPIGEWDGAYRHTQK